VILAERFLVNENIIHFYNDLNKRMRLKTTFLFFITLMKAQRPISFISSLYIFFLMTKVFQLRLQGRELVFFSSVRANALALPIFPLIPHPQITGFRFDENTKKGQG